jgi:hypothetical protein
MLASADNPAMAINSNAEPHLHITPAATSHNDNLHACSFALTAHSLWQPSWEAGATQQQLAALKGRRIANAGQHWLLPAVCTDV